MVNLWIVILILFAIAAICKAIMDTVDFRFENSIFNKIKSEQIRLWFNQSEGWKNKYKDRDPAQGRAFPGSLTWLVWVTDAWHFFQMIMLTCMQVAVIIPIIVIFGFPWWSLFVMLVVVKLYMGGIFELFWDKLLKDKKKNETKNTNNRQIHK